MVDSGPTYRAELNASLAIINPQIDGLDDLTRASLSQPSIDAIKLELADRRRRNGLITAVLNAMTALEADGYPALSLAAVDPGLVQEIAAETAAINAAVGIFGVVAVAASDQAIIDQIANGIKANTAAIDAATKP